MVFNTPKSYTTYTFFIIFFCCSTLFAQETGFPFIRNYTPKEYDNTPQVLSITHDKRGILYFGMASGGGIVEYDGKRWTSIEIPNKTGVFSLDIDSNDVVYAGVVNDFGYLQTNARGKKEFTSLRQLLPEKTLTFGFIRNIQVESNKIYFLSYEAIFEYTTSPTPTIKSYLPKTGNRLSGLSVHRGVVYAHESNRGLMRVGTDSLELISDFYTDKVFRAILPFSTDSILIPTRTEGLYFYYPNSVFSVPTSISENDFLTTNDIYSATLLPQQRIVLGSLGKGALLLSPQGTTIQAWNENNLLQDNSVYNIHTTTNQNVWLGLSNGISRSEVGTAWSYWNKNTGIKGSVLRVLRVKDTLYVATLNALYYFKNNRVIEIQGIPAGQRWDILEYTAPDQQKQLLIGASSGIYEIKEEQTNSIHRGNHAFKIHTSPSAPSRIYSTDYPYFISMSYSNNQWTDEGRWQGISDDIREIMEDENGDLWLGTYAAGVIRVTPDTQNITKPKNITYYTEKDGLPSLRLVYPYRIGQKIVFGTENGLYAYNGSTNRFEPYCQISAKLCNDSLDVFRISETTNGRIWVLPWKNKDNNIGYFQPDNKGDYNWLYKPFRQLPQMELECLYQDTNGIVWIGGTEGLFRYDEKEDLKNYDADFYTLVRKVTIGNDSVVYYGDATDNATLEGISLPEGLDYEHNSIKFEYAAPFFDNESKTLYRHWLEGFDDNWSNWSNEAYAVYTNLYEGNYTFRIQSRNMYDKEGVPSMFRFQILPPWYRSWWAWCIYLVCLTLAIVVIVKKNTQRLQKEKNNLELVVKDRTAEIIQQKEEIQNQRDEIENQRNEIEHSYNNIEMLSEIGKEIILNLNIEQIVDTVYRHVNKLMDATIFSVGIFHAEKNGILIFAKENNVTVKPYFYDFLDKNRMAVICFEQKQEIFINDMDVEYTQYMTERKKPLVGNYVSSLIYLPLMLKDQCVGTISVQSYNKSAYTHHNINLLRNIAIYTSIALENSNTVREIDQQKQEIEKSHRQITASINYAKRIQTAVFSNSQAIHDFFSQHFILFKPRDIVSGDFYFVKQVRNTTVIAVADCTGHGVPGAFMSMLGIAVLNEIIQNQSINNSSQILDELRRQIKHSLQQTGQKGEQQDGMDISFCAINNDTLQMSFAGANNSCWIIRENNHQPAATTNMDELKPTSKEFVNQNILLINSNTQLLTFEGDNQPVGIFPKEKPFSEHSIQLQRNDTLYLFSDGYYSQFDEVQGLPMGRKKFREIISQIYQLPMEEQNRQLDNNFNAWKGIEDQTDDVVVVGVKI